MDLSLSPDVLDQLNTEEARNLHSISDSLSACGIGRIVDLPQIIVVGQQSSGKSSVLEAISHIHFPVEGGLCTRFATELVLRRADETRVNVRVKFADKSKDPRAFHRTGFREHDLPDIIKEAKEYMGFTRAGKAFSKDVLRIEIQGPEMYPLSLVDLPGLFSTCTETQSLDDRRIVDELVESYMQQTSSIILVVITADNPLASHIALDRVKPIDPLGQRTIGVITKPDLARAGSDEEQTYVRVAKNQEGANKLQLGWHVLRNTAEGDIKNLAARDANEEKFFKTGAWAAIPYDDAGIQTFRQKLSMILYQHVRSSLPGVVHNIETKLRERQEQFDQLGEPRSSPKEKRSFLLAIAGEYQRLARDGVDGRYNDPFFGSLEDEAFKIRAQLRNFTRAFEHILRTKGATQRIVQADGDAPEGESVPEYLRDLLQQYQYDFPDPEVVTTKELGIQLQKQAAANQGREFPGSANKDLAMQLFKKQAAPWKAIAKFHISCVTLVAKAFVDALFKHIVGSPSTNSTTEAILSTCVDLFFEEKEKLLLEKLEELLKPYSQGYAVPLDSDFYSSLSWRTIDRLASRFCNAMKKEYPEMFEQDSKRRLSPETIAQAISSDEGLEDGEFGTDKVVDMMTVYYDMSRRTFTDNVVNLAIESCLICHIPDILTPTMVDRMSEEELNELATESTGTISRRKRLREEIDILRLGLAKCQRYKPRAITVLPPSTPKSSELTVRPAPNKTTESTPSASKLLKKLAQKSEDAGFLSPTPAPSTAEKGASRPVSPTMPIVQAQGAMIRSPSPAPTPSLLGRAASTPPPPNGAHSSRAKYFGRIPKLNSSICKFRKGCFQTGLSHHAQSPSPKYFKLIL